MIEMNFIKIIYFIPFLISHLMVNAQDLKRVLKTLEKRDIEKAKELLESQISKDSINPGSKWMYARLLSSDCLLYTSDASDE